MIGQMMEAVTLPPERDPASLPAREWAVGNRAAQGRESRHITSIHLVPEELEAITRERYRRYEAIKANETRYEYAGPGAPPVFGGGACEGLDRAADADMTLVAYGTSARVCLGARQLAEQAGIAVGLFRPVTLWPFPYKALGNIAGSGKPLLTVEMSLGQLVEDVKLSLLEAPEGSRRAPVHLVGHSGGVIPTEEEVFAAIKTILGK
jgi:2-oxoglutarate ferredoxin oxidoreductase subunit alpha